MTPVFADTWAWVALFNRRDAHHGAALKVWRQLRDQDSGRLGVFLS